MIEHVLTALGVLIALGGATLGAVLMVRTIIIAATKHPLWL